MTVLTLHQSGCKISRSTESRLLFCLSSKSLPSFTFSYNSPDISSAESTNSLLQGQIWYSFHKIMNVDAGPQGKKMTYRWFFSQISHVLYKLKAQEENDSASVIKRYENFTVCLVGVSFHHAIVSGHSVCHAMMFPCQPQHISHFNIIPKETMFMLQACFSTIIWHENNHHYFTFPSVWQDPCFLCFAKYPWYKWWSEKLKGLFQMWIQ